MTRHVRDFRRGYEVAGIDLATEVGEPPAAAGGQLISIATAVASPPPMQSAASPRFLPCFFSA